MPNTLIREGYLDSDRVSALSDFDDRVFFRVLLAADDAGRTDGRLDKLQSALFPTRKQVRGVDIQSTTGRLIAAGLLTQWEWDSKPIIQVMRWQRRSGAIYSKFPDRTGSFKIAWIDLETRDGVHAFSSTSIPMGLPTHMQPIDNPFGGVSPKPTDTDTKTDTKSKTDLRPVVPPGMARFWKLYPAIGRDRSSRKECHEQWKKLKCEPIADEIIAGLISWIHSPQWVKDAGQYVPAAHRWLKKEKWSQVPSASDSEPDDDRDSPGFIRRDPLEILRAAGLEPAP